jgi:hypothetical protein
MEYIYYLLIVSGLLLACLHALRVSGMPRLQSDKSGHYEGARQRRIRAGTSAEDAGYVGDRLKHHQQVLERSLASVPTPWGWPGHDDGHHSSGASHGDGVSESFHKWVDLLVREKQTVDDQAYRSRTNESLKALLEDRYAPGARTSTLDYRKTKASLLRNPGKANDQMVNFPSGRTGQIVDGLEREPGGRELERKLSGGMRQRTSLKEVRTPWGW